VQSHRGNANFPPENQHNQPDIQALFSVQLPPGALALAGVAAGEHERIDALEIRLRAERRLGEMMKPYAVSYQNFLLLSPPHGGVECGR